LPNTLWETKFTIHDMSDTHYIIFTTNTMETYQILRNGCGGHIMNTLIANLRRLLYIMNMSSLY